VSAGWQAALRELEHLAEHYARPVNGKYGQMAAGVLRDVLLILRTGGLVCEHRRPEP
jgi:hypothetical protein